MMGFGYWQWLNIRGMEHAGVNNGLMLKAVSDIQPDPMHTLVSSADTGFNGTYFHVNT